MKNLKIMSEFKKCKVIMLPTGDITGIVLHSTGLDKIFHTKESELKAVLDIGGVSQHLYVISNEEIKLGDYYYRPGFNEIFRGSGFVEGDSKVVASTEKLNELPQIPQSFIKQYCEAEGIDEIEIEYYSNIYPITFEIIETVKTDSNNCIIIKPIKESWTRKEVEEVALKVVIDYTSKGYSRPISDWIEQNL